MNRTQADLLNSEGLRLFFSCIVMTMAVFFFYSVGLAICVPFLLIGYSYYYESSLLNRQSKKWTISDGKIDSSQVIDHLFLGNTVLNVMVPAVFIQVVYFIYYTNTAELSPTLYDVLHFLKENIETNNSYFVDLYQKMPIFGYKKDFILMKGAEEVYLYNAIPFFLFYFVTMSTFIVGLVGAFFRLRNQNYSRLAKVLYSEDQIEDRLENSKISPNALKLIIFQSVVFLISPLYFVWKFQEDTFDVKRSFISMLAIYFISPMFSAFIYNSLSRLRGNNHGNK